MRPTLGHRLRNLAQAALLLGGMAALAWACASAIWGDAGGIVALVGVTSALALAPAAPKRLILSAYRARPLSERDFPLGVALMAALAERAGLPRPPVLWWVPSAVPNAFAVGSAGDGAIAVTDGMLRLLDARELAGVLAHEVSHIAHRDLWLMSIADVMGRLVALSSLLGQLLVLINLPLMMAGQQVVPWRTVALLLLAPTIMSLLQLALSRAREFEADRGAAQLTGDPAGLARALARLERRVGRLWEEIVMPGRRIPEPSLLRTHPSTEERVTRLLHLSDTGRPLGVEGEPWPPAMPDPVGPPRWRRTGLWF